MFWRFCNKTQFELAMRICANGGLVGYSYSDNVETRFDGRGKQGIFNGNLRKHQRVTRYHYGQRFWTTKRYQSSQKWLERAESDRRIELRFSKRHCYRKRFRIKDFCSLGRKDRGITAKIVTKNSYRKLSQNQEYK